MKRRIKTSYLLLIFMTTIGLDAMSQNISPKIDYTTDIFYSCDSIVQYEYGSITKQEWTDLDTENLLKHKESETKKVTYYKNDTLEKEHVYNWMNDTWQLTATILYKVNGSEITETSTASFGGQEFSITENYNLDYIWTTKLAPIDVLSPDEAGGVLFDENIKIKYENEMRKIVDGEISLHNNLKIFTNTEGDTIRIENSIQNEDKSIKIVATNFLRRETEKEVLYNGKGDVLQNNNRKYQYKYDDRGLWKLLNRGGYLIRREIF